MTAAAPAQTYSVPLRRVGFPLGAGIVVLPFIFAWFTLRDGHSTLARAVSLTWLGVFFIGAFTGNSAFDVERSATIEPASVLVSSSEDHPDTAVQVTTTPGYETTTGEFSLSYGGKTTTVTRTTTTTTVADPGAEPR